MSNPRALSGPLSIPAGCAACERLLPGFKAIVEACVAEARRTTGDPTLKPHDAHVLLQAASLASASSWSALVLRCVVCAVRSPFGPREWGDPI